MGSKDWCLTAFLNHTLSLEVRKSYVCMYVSSFSIRGVGLFINIYGCNRWQLEKTLLFESPIWSHIQTSWAKCLYGLTHSLTKPSSLIAGHSYIHSYIHTCISYIYTYIHTYVYVLAFTHSYIYTYIYMYVVRTCIHTYILSYINSYVYTYILYNIGT